jgi:hypothetical protein
MLGRLSNLQRVGVVVDRGGVLCPSRRLLFCTQTDTSSCWLISFFITSGAAVANSSWRNKFPSSGSSLVNNLPQTIRKLITTTTTTSSLYRRTTSSQASQQAHSPSVNLAQKVGKSIRRPGVMSKARVYAEVNVQRPKDYWDYEALTVQWG